MESYGEIGRVPVNLSKMISNVQYEEKYRVESQFGLIKINFRGNVE